MKELIKSYIVTFVFCFMLFIYEPLIMYSTNIEDFWFELGTMIKPMLLIFFSILFLGCFCFTLIYIINKKVFKNLKIYHCLLLLLCIFFFTAYIQGNYLTGRLPILDGNVIDWSIYKIENIITIVIWVLTTITIDISVHKFKAEKTTKIVSYISLAIFAMLLVSLSSVLLSYKSLENREKYYASSKNINTVSKNKNFLIFMLDAIDEDNFYEVLKSNEEYKDIFNDFTYYNDVMVGYPCTRDSIPLVLSGFWFRNEKDFSEFSTEAYNNSPLFETLKENNYKMNIYEEDFIWDGKKNYKIENIESSKNANIDLFPFFKEEIRYILFKYTPYFLKKYSYIENLNFSNCIVKYKFEDIRAYKNITRHPDLKTIDNNVFQFYHIEGAYVPYNYDKNLNKIKIGTYAQKIEAGITLIKEYLDRLKKNNVYDNSVIIIMADYGFANDKYFYHFNPIFMVKGINEKHDMIISDLPISFDDLQDAYKDLLDGKQSTDLFKDITKGRERTFIWYKHTNKDHMVEYSTIGMAKDIEKFKKTGRIFDR